jgi:hypothetical protein
MELVLGLLVFFGGFTLGSVTSGSADPDSSTAWVQSDGLGYHQPAAAASPSPKCPASGAAVTYRDLTIPYARPGVLRSTPAGDGEDDGDSEDGC